jgi:hypothetical protein
MDLDKLPPCRLCGSKGPTFEIDSKLIPRKRTNIVFNPPENIFYTGVARCGNCGWIINTLIGVPSEDELRQEEKEMLLRHARQRWILQNEKNNPFIEENTAFISHEEIMGDSKPEAIFKQHSFKIGDRVIAYGPCFASLYNPLSIPIELKGVIVAIDDPFIEISVLIRGKTGYYKYYHKQCRKLVKKKRERFFYYANKSHSKSNTHTVEFHSETPNHVTLTFGTLILSNYDDFMANIRKVINYLNKHWDD